MRHIKTALIFLGAFALGCIVSLTPAEANSQNDIVGSWEVQAIGAPFQPHLFTFSSDGNMFTTNPTDVQVETSNTNDSVGMGTWRRDGKYVFGTFYQLNADATTHLPVDTLEVRFRVQVNGDKFTGDWQIVAFDARGTFTADRLAFKRWAP